MAKEKDQNTKDNKNLLICFLWNFSAELKLIFMALLVLCTLATLLPFIPSSFSISASFAAFFLSNSSCLMFSSCAFLNSLMKFNKVAVTAPIDQSPRDVISYDNNNEPLSNVLHKKREWSLYIQRQTLFKWTTLRILAKIVRKRISIPSLSIIKKDKNKPSQDQR